MRIMIKTHINGRAFEEQLFHDFLYRTQLFIVLCLNESFIQNVLIFMLIIFFLVLFILVICSRVGLISNNMSIFHIFPSLTRPIAIWGRWLILVRVYG